MAEHISPEYASEIKKLGAAIEAYLTENELTIESLAVQIYVSKQVIRNVMHGYKMHSIHTMLLIAKAINYSHYELVFAWLENEFDADFVEQLRVGADPTDRSTTSTTSAAPNTLTDEGEHVVSSGRRRVEQDGGAR